MGGDDGLAPHLNGEIYWQPWIDSEGKSDVSIQDQVHYDVRFDCRKTAGNLECKKGNWGVSQRNFPNFFGRLAYHLFFSTRRQEVKSRKEITEKSWLLSAMYRMSLENKETTEDG